MSILGFDVVQVVAYGPLPSLKASELWAPSLKVVSHGFIRIPG